jgi:hypothetical protein
MTPVCIRALAKIDAASLSVLGSVGAPPSPAEKAVTNLAENAETGCLEEITDWSLAVKALEKRLARAARIAGKTAATVSCDTPAAWVELEQVPGFETVGYVDAAETLIHLAPLTCFALARLLRHPDRLACVVPSGGSSRRCSESVTEEGIAVVTLAHEQQHVDGETNEALAQCYAFQRAQPVARSLGVPLRAARRLAALAKSARAQPFSYSSTECRRGGSFDLHLPGPWPLPT